MSADNRTIIFNDGDDWRVWEGSCSTNYYEAPQLDGRLIVHLT